MQNTAPDMGAVSKKVVHVAVGVVWRQGRVLLARRPDHVHQGGLLEFPGGKVEPGESVRQALARELAEETALSVAPEAMTPLIGIRHDYGDKEVFLDVWQAHDSLGDAQGLEGQPVFWEHPARLRVDEFPAANGPIIRAIQLPGRLAISGDGTDPSQALAGLKHGASTMGDALLMVRMPSLSPEDYTAVVSQSLAALPQVPLIVHDRPELVAQLPVAGVHLSWRRASALDQRPIPGDRWLGVSCHNEQELAHAARIGADYATLGPVLPTGSHPGAEPMGWTIFAEIAARAIVPVYALGGVGPDQQAEARARGGQGVAGISWWWRS